MLDFHCIIGGAETTVTNIVTDLDFTDKVALLTEEIEPAQKVINRLKLEAG